VAAPLPPPPPPPGRALLDPDHEALDCLSQSQRQVVRALLDGRNIFLTGRAGSGKSRTLQAVIAAMDAMGTYVAVTAMSGIATAPLKGYTLDSYMCTNDDRPLEDTIRRVKLTRPELVTLQVLIVGEVSMMSAEKMQMVMNVFRAVRPPESPYPQFLLVGDFKQLPPVTGTLLLNSPTWSRLSLQVVLLTDSFRQQGQGTFLDMLDEVGMGQLSTDSRDLLESRVGVAISTDDQDIRPTVLVPRRDTAGAVNLKELDLLVSPVNPKHSFVAKIRHLCAPLKPTDPWTPVQGCSPDPPAGWTLPALFADADVSIECTRDVWAEAEAFAKTCMDCGVFEATVGAQVVFTANIDAPRIVNGTRGVVTAFTPHPVVTLLNGDTVVAEPYVVTRRVKRANPSPVFQVEYMPLKLAWALTIHASQGMSLDFAEVDLGPRVFSDGQGYVALSRVRTLEGLALQRFHPAAIRANPVVVKWYQDLYREYREYGDHADHSDHQEEEANLQPKPFTPTPTRISTRTTIRTTIRTPSQTEEHADADDKDSPHRKRCKIDLGAGAAQGSETDPHPTYEEWMVANADAKTAAAGWFADGDGGGDGDGDGDGDDYGEDIGEKEMAEAEAATGW
jgi:hypothetical protein